VARDLGRPPLLSGQRPRSRRRPTAAGKWAAFAVLALAAWAAGMLAHHNPAPLSDNDGDAVAVAAADAAAATGAATTDTGDAGGAEALAAAIEADHGAAPGGQAAQLFGPDDPFVNVRAQLGRGETLGRALVRGGLPEREAERIIAALRGTLDFRRLKPGANFEGVLWLGEELISGTFRHGRLDRYVLESAAGNVRARHAPIVPTAVTTAVAGTVESSLFGAIQTAGERASLIMAFIDLFSWEFDFAIETRRGDRFEMLVEKQYVDGEFFDYGPIRAARYKASDRDLAACWYEGGDASGYYNRDGSSVKRAFLRAPVKHSRISSGFTHSRFHPVLKVHRPHRGIDYAAPTGTPVYTVGDGTVIGAGRMGGAGLAVRVRHPNGWITSYSHLSKIHVRRGQRLRQGQLIGRVGSTGYSTGPHLDYRITINGQFVNPLKVRFPRGEPIPATARAAFTQQCEAAMDLLDRRTAPQVAQAAPTP